MFLLLNTKHENRNYYLKILINLKNRGVDRRCQIEGALQRHTVTENEYGSLTK